MYDVAAKKITIIPARAKILQSNTQENKMIVCAYARVSTVTNTFLQHGRSALSI